jgi:PPM family protein phosphatase
VREHVETFGLSDRGRRRRRNEDAILYPALELDVSGERYCLLAVADGVGGGPAGEVASHAAIHSLRSARRPWTQDGEEVLRRLFVGANSAVALRSVDGDAGMATTLVAALISATQLWVANVGDSRAYLVTHDGIRRLTQDHTWVAERVKAGYMTEAEAAESPQRNLITRSLGERELMEPDVFGPHALGAGDVVVLCSDGLHTIVNDEEISETCRRLSAAAAVHSLIRLANDRGGPDNVSLIMVRLKG